VSDPTSEFFPCQCVAVNATAPDTSALSVVRRLLQMATTYNTKIKGKFRITMSEESAILYPDSNAVTDLATSIATAIATDLQSNNSVIIAEGGTATANIDPASAAASVGVIPKTQAPTTRPTSGPVPAPPPTTSAPVPVTSSPSSGQPPTSAPTTAAPTGSPISTAGAGATMPSLLAYAATILAVLSML